jgi:hypothetical protein
MGRSTGEMSMGETVTQDRITVYQIPRGKVRFVLAPENGEPIMSPVPMTPGLYHRDPLRSVAGSDFMYLAPCQHQTTFYVYRVWVKDVARFARNFVPEDHLLPQDGKCFMGLNFSESDFPAVQHAIELACCQCVELDIEGALAAICSEYTQRRRDLSVSSKHLSCPPAGSEIGSADPPAGASFAQEIRDTAVSDARYLAEQVEAEKGVVPQ